LLWSQVCTSRLDHDVTLQAAAAAAAAAAAVVAAVSDVSTELLCDTAMPCCDVANLPSLPPTHTSHTHCNKIGKTIKSSGVCVVNIIVWCDFTARFTKPTDCKANSTLYLSSH